MPASPRVLPAPVPVHITPSRTPTSPPPSIRSRPPGHPALAGQDGLGPAGSSVARTCGPAAAGARCRAGGRVYRRVLMASRVSQPGGGRGSFSQFRANTFISLGNLTSPWSWIHYTGLISALLQLSVVKAAARSVNSDMCTRGGGGGPAARGAPGAQPFICWAADRRGRGGDGGGRPLPRGCGTGPKRPRSPSGSRRGPGNSAAQRAGGEAGAVPGPVCSCWWGSAGARIAVCASSPALGALMEPSVSNAPQPSVTDEAAPARLPAVTRSADPHLPHRREPHQKPGGARCAAQEGRGAPQPQEETSVPRIFRFYFPRRSAGAWGCPGGGAGPALPAEPCRAEPSGPRGQRREPLSRGSSCGQPAVRYVRCAPSAQRSPLRPGLQVAPGTPTARLSRDGRAGGSPGKDGAARSSALRTHCGVTSIPLIDKSNKSPFSGANEIQQREFIFCPGWAAARLRPTSPAASPTGARMPTAVGRSLPCTTAPPRLCCRPGIS